MATITIQIADEDRTLFEQLAKRLNAKIVKSDDGIGEKKPNAVTIQAAEDARKGNTTKIEDIDKFFASL